MNALRNNLELHQLYFLVENQYQPNEKAIFLYGNSLPTKKTPLKTSFKSDDYSKKIKILLATTILNFIELY